MTIETPMTQAELAVLDERQRNHYPYWELTPEEVARAYAAGRRNFIRANLEGANLEGANLEGAYLEGAYLRGANLEGAYLEGAYLEGANLRGANLEGANLEGAYLEGAYLEGAYLRGANLEGAYLRGANLRGANLGGANLEGAYLEGANLRGANLGGANLGGANLGGANLGGANLINVPGVYSVYSPFLSSRGAALLGGLVIADGAIQLRLWAGCQECVTADYLRQRARRTHGDTLHGRHYALAMSHIEAAFALDMAEGKWDYLLTWNADHAEPAPEAEPEAADTAR